MKQTLKQPEGDMKKVFVKGYMTATGRIVPGHYRAIPLDPDPEPKGTYISRRLINPPKKRTSLY